jgi:pyruvate formate lyase activating enzyme
MRGVVFDIKRFAVHDGPGIRTTVFLKGCPLRCRWCHNPESLEASPCKLPRTYHTGTSVFTEMEEVGREWTVEELMHELRKEKVFMDESGGGVTFSGGEPLFQPAFLKEMLMACKAEGMHTAVDTSGYASPSVLHSILSCTDLFLYDLKIIDSDIHLHWTGVENTIILANFDRLIKEGARVRVRIPLIPGVSDSESENLNAIFRFLEPYRDRLDGIDLLPFHTTATHKYERLGLQYEFKGMKTNT